MMTNYSGNLHGPVEVGHIFVIAGKTIDAATAFAVNLACGKSPEADIPLHLAVRFHSESIVRNTLQEGSWGEEESEENILSAPNPLMSGCDFKFYILVGDDKFHVAINEQPFCTYNFRMPLEEIHAVNVVGDVQCITRVDHRKAYPSPWPMIQEDIKTDAFSGDVPRQYMPGHVMIITAIPCGNPVGSFSLRFTEGTSKKQIFHMSARFNQRSTVFNGMTDSLDWRKDEERNTNFAFVLDQQFKMSIAFTESAFEVAVNGYKFHTYTYRGYNSLLDTLMGIKFTTGNGMTLEVTGIDHMDTGMTDCEGFETYSHPDVLIL